MKTYRQLTKRERMQTWKNYEMMCEKSEGCIESFETFEEYDEQQMILDMDFDAKTLECLG